MTPKNIAEIEDRTLKELDDRIDAWATRFYGEIETIHDDRTRLEQMLKTMFQLLLEIRKGLGEHRESVEGDVSV